MKAITVETWLPMFSGFYNTIWEASEDSEIEYVNELRAEKGLPNANFDAFEFDYAQYNEDVVRGICKALESRNELKQFISSIEFQRINSPKEYNFRNDSADVLITLTPENQNTIREYLENNIDAFATSLKDKYTSCSGFISSYPNSPALFVDDFNEAIQHAHKLGSILQFICENEGVEEINLYYDVEANLSTKNFEKLTTV